MNVITNDLRVKVVNSSSITCLTTRSVVEANFELPHITEATTLIAIVEDSKISPHHRSEKHVEDVPIRDLAGDASVPICRPVYHEGVITGDNSLVLAARSQVASCPSRLEMFHHYEEQDIPETRREMADNFETRTASNKGQLVWDLVRDNTVLREFYHNRQNLVLDSLSPELAPHIVVTLAKEGWSESVIPWQNRVDYQQAGYLMVPYHPVLSDCCPSRDGHLNHDTQVHSSQSSANIIPTPFCRPKHVFNASVFNKQIDDASIERLVLHHIVRILQKQRCKTAFFNACNVAITFRRRYDSSPDLFSAIERSYVWSDPAEPILFLSQRLLGTTIIDSHSPFRVPHIVINAPPPQDLWIPWNNATNDPQDHGFGRFLIVPSPSVGVINTSIEDWEVYSSPDSSAAGSTVNPSEGSQPGTPMPETPMDDVDLSFFIARPGDDIGGGMVDNFGYSGLSFEPNSNELPWAPDPPRPYRPIFSIEEDEDDLPPFDDWYKQ